MTALVTSPVIPAIVALVPGFLRWWWGRTLARLADDAALPERLIASRRRNSIVLFVSLATLVAVWTSTLGWTIPLLVGARFLAAYPLRKTLYRETWSVAAYAWFFFRLLLAVFGFWVTLAAAPWIVRLAGDSDWIAGALLGAGLVAVNARYSDVVRWVLGARPIGDPILLSRFSRMAEVCQLPPVRLDRVDLHGGVFANALALPSNRRPAVVVSETLIDRLDGDEVAAICAHELAHLEHFNGRRLRTLAVVTNALIAGAVALPVAARVAFHESASIIVAVWPAVLFISLALRVRDRQKQETASDVRAVSLSGDPEALVRALSKLHAIARIPRRWQTEFERQASHPSLARRVQAIRAAAGQPPIALGESATFATADGGSSIVFDRDRLTWTEGASATHTVAYGSLAELRIDARHADAARLIAVDATGRRWDAAIGPADVARVQSVLDLVDGRLAPHRSPERTSPTVARVIAVAAALTAASFGQFAAAFLALMAAAAPVRPLIAAAGTGAIAAAAVLWRDHSAPARDDPAVWIAVAVFLFGVVLLALVRVGTPKPADDERDRVPAVRLVALLAIVTTLAWIAAAAGGFNAVRLHQTARAWPAVAVLSFALAAALALTRARHARYASIGAAIAGAAILFAGSTAFLDRFSDDLFVAPADPIRLRASASTPVAEFPLPTYATDVRVSASGRNVIVVSENDEEEMTFDVGRAGGPLIGVDADQLVFAGDDRVLALKQRHDVAILRELSAEDGAPTAPDRRFSDLSDARLSRGAGADQWRLVGWNHDGDLVGVAGSARDSRVTEERWGVSRHRLPAARPVAVSGGRALIVDTEFERAPLQTAGLWRWSTLLMTGMRSHSHLWMSGGAALIDAGVSQLDVNCPTATIEAQPVCAAYDDTRTRFFTIDPATGWRRAAGWARGRFVAHSYTTRGWIDGWWRNTAVAVRLDTGEAWSLPLRRGVRASRVVATERFLVALLSDARGTTVRLYPIPPIAPRQ